MFVHLYNVSGRKNPPVLRRNFLHKGRVYCSSHAIRAMRARKVCPGKDPTDTRQVSEGNASIIAGNGTKSQGYFCSGFLALARSW